MRKVFVVSMLAALFASACATSERASTAEPARASSAAFLFAEFDAAALVEWTEREEGDVVGNISVAHTNTAGMNVEQAVSPIAGFVTDAGDVALEYGKGAAAVNLTGRIDGDTLTLAGPFGLGDRTQITLSKAEPGDWDQAVADVQATVDAAYAAESAAAGEPATSAESADGEVDPPVQEITEDPVGDPYVDIEAENRAFDAEIYNIEVLTADAEAAVEVVRAAAAVEPMTSEQLVTVRASVVTVDLTATDARSALARLEQQYADLPLLLEALRPFTARLDAARETVARADAALAEAFEIHDDAALRVTE